MVTANYLHQLGTNVLNIWMQYKTVTHAATNNTLTKCTCPKLYEIYVGTNVVLLKHDCVERGIMNGYIGFYTGLFITHTMDLHNP